MLLRFICFMFTLLLSTQTFAGQTVQRIKGTGVVRCGVRTTANAFAYKDEKKEWQGIDIEMCRLVASAIVGREEAIQVIPVNKEEGLVLLDEGKIDVLGAATPYTMNLELNSHAVFPAVFYHSALAFIGHYKPEARSMKDYQGSSVCVESSPFLLYELEKYNQKHELNMRLMRAPHLGRAKELLYLKRCDLVFARLETLHSNYFKQAPKGIDLVVLPEIVRTYPTGPYIQDNDPEFYKIIKWLVYAVIKAEEKGVSIQNVEDFKNTRDEEIKNLLADNPREALKLGLDAGWIYRAIAQRGNYAEIYDRGLGEKSILKLNRTANKLRKDGGLIDSENFEK